MKHSDQYVALDLVRGMAALMVCAGHIRNFLFVDFGEVINPNIFDKLFYFATGFGHQAVIIFFVLSGYFVGGSVWSQLAQNKFSWVEYSLLRLSRLWVVLLPALVATWCFDSLGMFLSDNAGYDGRWKGLLLSGPGEGADGIALSPLTLLGNVFFMQTISVPVFGSNGPLWSLANEFWYYLTFPFLAIALVKRTVLSWIAAAIMGGVFACLPAGLQSGFMFWLMGCVAATAGVVRLPARRWSAIIGLAIFVMALAVTKILSGFNADLVVAASTMLLLFVLPKADPFNLLLVRGATLCSDMSYTLYLFHFPFVAFCWYVYIAPGQMQPTIWGYSQVFILLAMTLAFCFCMWWIFERHTQLVRTFLKARLVNFR